MDALVEGEEGLFFYGGGGLVSFVGGLVGGKRGGGIGYVPSDAAVWLMGMGLDGTRVLVLVLRTGGVGVGGRCGRGDGGGAWFGFGLGLVEGCEGGGVKGDCGREGG